MESRPREIHLYKTEKGKEPFSDWFHSLRDQEGRNKIRLRLDRLEDGDFGFCRSVGKGVWELKVKGKGPGYRVYYGLDGLELVLLLSGGDKKSQDEDILKAQKYWEEYKARK